MGTEGLLVDAYEGLIEALRIQTQLARNCGGDIAVNEGNGKAWDDAKRAIIFARQFKIVNDARCAALQVVSKDKRISAWLKENDPKALEQVRAAIGE